MAGRGSFEESVAIVTGGGVSPGRVASIGEATCRRLAARGARVVVVDIDGGAALTTVKRITEAGGQSIAIAADLSSEGECQRAVAECVDRWKAPNILVNNVAVASGTVVTATEETEFDAAMAVNFKSAMWMAKHAISAMTGGGAIVNVSSTALVHPTWSLNYSASKGALEAMTSHIAMQYGPDGIRCNTVRPGEVWTSMIDRHVPTEEQAEMVRAERAKRCLLPRGGDGWDVAEAIVFLASDEARWITGQTLSVDGGASLIGPNPDWKDHVSYWKARAQGRWHSASIGRRG